MFLQLESDTSSPVSIQVSHILQIRPSRDNIKQSVVHLPNTSIAVKIPYDELMKKLESF